MKPKSNDQNNPIFDFAGLLSIIDEDLTSDYLQDHFSRDAY